MLIKWPVLRQPEFRTSRFTWIKPYEELSDNKRKVVLCHYPIMCYNGQYRLDEEGNPKTYMLYGHVHDTQDQRLLEQFQEITRNTKTINAKGELVGIAFDGNWEAMSGNIAFNPDLQRCISVDIRYVLFIIDKYAGATNLIKEMKIVK